MGKKFLLIVLRKWEKINNNISMNAMTFLGSILVKS